MGPENLFCDGKPMGEILKRGTIQSDLCFRKLPLTAVRGCCGGGGTGAPVRAGAGKLV